MIYDKFYCLIKYLVKCNGTCKEELEKRVENGDVTSEEAVLINYYVEAEKLIDKLDMMSAKLG